MSNICSFIFLFWIENVIYFSRIYWSESFESSNRNTIFGYYNKFLCHWHHNIDFIEPFLHLKRLEPRSFSLYQTFHRSANDYFKGNFSLVSFVQSTERKTIKMQNRWKVFWYYNWNRLTNIAWWSIIIRDESLKRAIVVLMHDYYYFSIFNGNHCSFNKQFVWNRFGVVAIPLKF